MATDNTGGADAANAPPSPSRPPPPPPLYAAVVAEPCRLADVQRLLGELPRDDDDARKAILDATYPNTDGHHETSLEAAHRLMRWEVAAALVVAGADTSGVFKFSGEEVRPSALAACVAYGSCEGVRALLKQGHDAKQRVPYREAGFYTPPDNPRLGWLLPPNQGRSQFCTLAHLCLAPPRLTSTSPRPPSDSLAPRLEILTLLVKEGGFDLNNDVDVYGQPALFWVGEAYSDHEKALDVLIKLGADVNRRCGKRLGVYHLGNMERDTPVLALLRRCGWSDPHLVPCLRKLVAAGAQVSGVFSADGDTPLMVAAEHGLEDVVAFFIDELRVPVNERDASSSSDSHGEIALHACFRAIEYNNDREHHDKVFAALLKAGADVHAVDKSGRTPLFGAAWQLDADAVDTLLSRGASADVIDVQGYTPVMQAADPCVIAHDEGEILLALVEASSPETRRATLRKGGGSSAVDAAFERAEREGQFLDWEGEDEPEWPLDYLQPAHLEALELLLEARAPVRPKHAAEALAVMRARLLPRAERADAELARRRSPRNRWRGEDEIVQMAFDVVELREAEEGVRRREARVRELEEELRRRGEEEEEEEDDDDESGDGGGAAGGGSTE